MDSLVIDLETIGVKPGCVILSIGALEFDSETGNQGKSFYKAISVVQSKMMGFHEEIETVIWWQNQCIDSYLLSHSGTESPPAVLRALNKWIFETYGSNDFYVYGNSAHFDFGILSAAYNMCNLPYPINSFLERDYRTLTKLTPWTRAIRDSIPFVGLKHHPEHDCRHEAKVITAIMNKLRMVA